MRHSPLRCMVRDICMLNETRKILQDLMLMYPQLLDLQDAITDAFTMLAHCYNQDGKILICGNGGSCSDTQHVVAELMKGFRKQRPLDINESLWRESPDIARKLQYGIPAISLCAHSSLISAYANDVSPDFVYAQQVFSYYLPNDVLICFSTSGNSRNVVAAAQTMKAIGGKVISFTGNQGGQVKEYSDICLQVPQKETYLVQEMHLPIYHCICAMLEEELFR